MRRLIITLLGMVFILLISCCSDKKNNKPKLIDTENLFKNNFYKKNKTNLKLPVGSKVLSNTKKYFIRNGGYDNKFHSKNTIDLQWYYRYKIGNVTKTKKLPGILNKKVITINSNDLSNDFLNIISENFNTRLVNIGKYILLYKSAEVYKENTKKLKQKGIKQIPKRYGTLILCDSLFKTKKIIDAYHEIEYEGYKKSRFFYIDYDKKIKIFEHFDFGEHQSIIHTNTIKIEGFQIIVENINSSPSKLTISEFKKQSDSLAKQDVLEKKMKLTKDSLRSIIQEKKYKKQIDSLQAIITPIEKKLPFGSELLLNHKFPDSTFLSDFDNESNPHQEELYKIWNYYVKETPYAEDVEGNVLPKTDIIKPIKLSADWYMYGSVFDDLKDYFKNPNEVKTFTSRLGNIGIYETYYHLFNDGDSSCLYPVKEKEIIKYCCAKSKYFYCNANGVLVLYNRNKREANVAHVYNLTTSDHQMIFRFFHISKSGKIKVYDGFSDGFNRPEGNTIIANNLIERFEITVTETGKINVLEKNIEE